MYSKKKKKKKKKKNRKNGYLWRDEDSCISGLDDKDVISINFGIMEFRNYVLLNIKTSDFCH